MCTGLYTANTNIPIAGGTYGKASKMTWTWNDIVNPHSAEGLSVEWGSHEPGDGTGEEVLIAEAYGAHHGCVSLPEGLRYGLELGAHLDEAV